MSRTFVTQFRMSFRLAELTYSAAFRRWHRARLAQMFRLLDRQGSSKRAVRCPPQLKDRSVVERHIRRVQPLHLLWAQKRPLQIDGLSGLGN